MKVAVFLAIIGVAVAHPFPNKSEPGFIPSPKLLERSSGKITGGMDAAPGELPYQVSVQFITLTGEKLHNCGGTIVSPTKIVTANHCVLGDGIVRQLSITAGASNIQITEPSQQIRSIIRVVSNPQWDMNAFNHDSAVITLSEPLEFNDLVQPLRLPTLDEPAVGQCVASGWGNANENGDVPYIVPDVLQKITLEVVDQEECAAIYADINPIDETMVCVRGLTSSPNLGACNGDSGGPLACTDSNGEQYLAGIASWAIQPCGRYEFPTVYTRVAAQGNLAFILDNADDVEN